MLFIETPTFILVKWIQCDQISRNDATLAKILKDFGNFGAFVLYLPNYFGKFIGQIVIDVNVTVEKIIQPSGHTEWIHLFRPFRGTSGFDY